jgi:undecaprenyl-diphosphatase
MTVMAHASQASSPPPGEPASRRDARVALAAASLGLPAVLFAVTPLLVEVSWGPLLEVDQGARDRRHRFAVTSPGFVTAMRLISDFGLAVA